MTYNNITEINQMGTYFLIILDHEVDFRCPQRDSISVCVPPSSKNVEHNLTLQALTPGQRTVCAKIYSTAMRSICASFSTVYFGAYCTCMLIALLSEQQFNVWPPLCQFFIIILQPLDVIPRF
jgi:hypothetical protein